MSADWEFVTPPAPIQRLVGALAIKHSHLDHAMRLCIKRMLGIGIRHPLYDLFIDAALTGSLRDRATKLLRASELNKADRQRIIELLLEAQTLSTLRNRWVHGIWAKKPGVKLRVLDKKQWYPVPSTETLKLLGADIDRVAAELDEVTKVLLKPEKPLPRPARVVPRRTP